MHTSKKQKKKTGEMKAPKGPVRTGDLPPEGHESLEKIKEEEQALSEAAHPGEVEDEDDAATMEHLRELKQQLEGGVEASTATKEAIEKAEEWWKSVMELGGPEKGEAGKDFTEQETKELLKKVDKK